MTEIGSAAPDLTLPDQYGRPTSLAELRHGRAVLVVFFPFAFSRICTGELAAIQRDLERFDNDRVTTVGVSCDPVYSLKAWAQAEGLEMPLLSDFWAHGEVARSYGVLDERAGMPVRGTFLIDEHGVVRWTLVNPPGEARDFTGFHRALDALPAGAD
ncbi:peroxiredoxin [Luteipulveratus halotolerans]|uniref:Alkyl hydroperoxide reductase E n=1 Tax=Luteipulveratus halotolerans TaxID=1631356 RepID=A0A0L6CI39_9MICO|nr:peroxiredoxin [Luteipulveratus halotolerans]KNX37404.1 peroxiredoxin [Luteipulveratus halotolerans]